MPTQSNMIIQGQKKLRIMLLGSKDVGKSTITRVLTKPRFPFFLRYRHTHMKTTHTKVVEDCIVELYDTASEILDLIKIQEISSFFDAFILVYAVNVPSSFDYIAKIREIITSSGGNNEQIFVARNKTDLPSRSTDRIVADCIVSIDWNCRHYEVSARTKQGIPNMLKDIVNRLNISKSNTAAIVTSVPTKKTVDNLRR